jgi:beta-glucosidase
MKAMLAAVVLLTAVVSAGPAHAETPEFLWSVSSSGFQSEGSSPDSN